METTIVLTGRIPSKKNSKRWIKRGRFNYLVPSEDHEVWHQQAMDQLKKQAVIPIQGQVGADVAFYMPDDRKADLSNKFESIADLLKDYGVIEDDKWQIMPVIILQSMRIDRINPRAIIRLYSIEA